MPWIIYPPGKCHWYPVDRKLGGPQSWYGSRRVEKNSLPMLGIKPRQPSPLTFATLMELSWLFKYLFSSWESTPSHPALRPSLYWLLSYTGYWCSIKKLNTVLNRNHSCVIPTYSILHEGNATESFIGSIPTVQCHVKQWFKILYPN
jgi:hypothetical protein